MANDIIFLKPFMHVTHMSNVSATPMAVLVYSPKKKKKKKKYKKNTEIDYR